ncbi:hypothetical protein DVQ80_01450 [Yersinia enterocolitica]|nr:hypothetical protein [Yersinia enterocolitica]
MEVIQPVSQGLSWRLGKTRSGVATPRGVAKPRIDKLKFEHIFKYQASLRWGFFVSEISPRILVRKSTKSLSG